MYEAEDSLLNVISAKREISWAEYKKLYDNLYTAHILSKALGESNVNFKRSQTARGLDALGHCDFEFSKDVQSVFSAPPVLARLPETGLPKATLVGSRLPRTIIRLKELAKKSRGRVRVKLDRQPDDYILAPLRVVLEADYVKDLSDFSESMGVKFENEPAAWSVINFSSSLSQYIATLSWSRRRDLNWPRSDFSLNTLTYRRAQQQNGDLRLSRYVDPTRNVDLYLLWNADECAEVDRDWGRYAALQLAGINIVQYDVGQFEFTIPSSVPLPKLIARALTLCSGLLPTVTLSTSERSSFSSYSTSVYRGIPPTVAELAATKIGQALAR
jgi:hypothetical protein